jgi:hypothetical protein
MKRVDTLPLCPNLAGFEEAPTTANCGDEKKAWILFASVAILNMWYEDRMIKNKVLRRKVRWFTGLMIFFGLNVCLIWNYS